MNKNSMDYYEELYELLRDPEEALSYLNAAAIDEDQRVFLLAINNVVKAYGGDISKLSKETKLNKQNLYRILTEQGSGNPNYKNLRSILHAVGFGIAVQPLNTIMKNKKSKTDKKYTIKEQSDKESIFAKDTNAKYSKTRPINNNANDAKNSKIKKMSKKS